MTSSHAGADNVLEIAAILDRLGNVGRGGRVELAGEQRRDAGCPEAGSGTFPAMGLNCPPDITFRDAMSGGITMVAVVIRRCGGSAFCINGFPADMGASYETGCTPPAPATGSRPFAAATLPELAGLAELTAQAA